MYFAVPCTIMSTTRYKRDGGSFGGQSGCRGDGEAPYCQAQYYLALVVCL